MSTPMIITRPVVLIALFMLPGIASCSSSREAEIRTLEERFHAGDASEADAAIAALAEIGEPVPGIFVPDAVRRLSAGEVDRWGPAYIRFAEVRAERGHAEQSVELLNALLACKPNDAIRAAAISMSGRLGDASVAASLVPYLADSSPEVAEAAYGALVALKDSPSRSAFRRRNEHSPSTVNARLLRMYAFAEPIKKALLLKVIAARELPEAKQMLLDASASDVPEVRRMAFAVMADSFDGQDPTLQGLFLQAARTDPQVRPEAIRGCIRYATFLQTMDQPGALMLYRELLELAPEPDIEAAVQEAMTRAQQQAGAASQPASTRPTTSSSPA